MDREGTGEGYRDFLNIAGTVVQEKAFQVNNTTGTFTVTLTSLFAGQTVRVRASGDNSLTVALISFPVNSPTTVTLTATPASSVLAPARPTFTIRVHPAVGGMGAPQGGLVLRDGSKVLMKLFTTDTSTFTFAANGDGVFTVTPTLPVDTYTLGADFIRSGGFVGSASTDAATTYRIDGLQPRMFMAMEGVPDDVVALADGGTGPITGRSRMLGSINISGGLALNSGAPTPTGKFSLFEVIAGTVTPVQTPQTPLNFSNRNGGVYVAYFNLSANRISRDTRNFILKYSGDLIYPPVTRNLAISPAGFVPRIDFFWFNPPAGITTTASPVRLNEPFQPRLTLMELNALAPGFGPCPPDLTTCASGLEMKVARDADTTYSAFATAQLSPVKSGDASVWIFDGQLPAFKTAGSHTLKFRYLGHYYYDDFELQRQVEVQKGLPVKSVAATSSSTGAVSIVVDLNSACLVAGISPGNPTCASSNAPDGTWRILEDKVERTSAPAAPRMTFNLQTTTGSHTYTVFYAGNTQWEAVSMPVTVIVK